MSPKGRDESPERILTDLLTSHRELRRQHDHVGGKQRPVKADRGMVAGAGSGLS
jgi:hypothetical protein